MKKELELYIHIPFCVKKCAYCDFLSEPGDEKAIEIYVEALLREIRAYRMLSAGYVVTTVFLGGGTPSILSGNQTERIMEALRNVFEMASDAEISMEANPGTVTREKLEKYKRAGINRISFGLQSTNNEELKLLGRIHTYEAFLESYQLARECGFVNINVDLISAIPKQTLESWETSLKQIIELNPEHISAYSLIIEEGTLFAKLYGEGTDGEKELPDEEAEREMYHSTELILKAAGYHRYEISNYAKPGKECRHNLGYWERKNYLGIGLGSSSLIDNMRYKNTENMHHYLQHADTLTLLQEEKQVLSKTEQMEEFVFLGLRKMEGISKGKFEKIFGAAIEVYYGKNIQRLKKDKFLIEEGDYLRLTQRGIDISNYVFAEFLYS